MNRMGSDDESFEMPLAESQKQEQLRQEERRLDKKCASLEYQNAKKDAELDWSIKKLEEDIAFLEKENTRLTEREIELGLDIESGDEEVDEIEKNKENSLVVKLEQENSEIEKTKLKIKKVVETIEALKQQSKGLDGDASPESQSQLKSGIEAELHLARERCSRTRAENEALRNSIGALRDEHRGLADNLKRLEQKLLAKRRAYAKLCQATSAAQEACQETTGRIRVLKDRGHKILNSLENEEKATLRAIDNEKKLRVYLEGKLAERMGLPDEDKFDSKAKNKSRINSPNAIKGLTDYQDFVNKVSQRGSMKLVGKREQLPTLIERYSSKEKENFSLFNKINRVNSEIEYTQHQIESIEIEIEGIQEESKTTEMREGTQIQGLESEIASLKAETEKVNQKSAEADELLHLTRDTAEKLCRLTGVDLKAITEVMGEGALKSSTLLFGQLEKQIHLIGKIYNDSVKTENEVESAKATNPPARTMSSKPPNMAHQMGKGEQVSAKNRSVAFSGTTKALDDVDRAPTAAYFDRLMEINDDANCEAFMSEVPLTRAEMSERLATRRAADCHAELAEVPSYESLAPSLAK